MSGRTLLAAQHRRSMALLRGTKRVMESKYSTIVNAGNTTVVSGTEGRRFEPCQAYHLFFNSLR